MNYKRLSMAIQTFPTHSQILLTQKVRDKTVIVKIGNDSEIIGEILQNGFVKKGLVKGIPDRISTIKHTDIKKMLSDCRIQLLFDDIHIIPRLRGGGKWTDFIKGNPTLPGIAIGVTGAYLLKSAYDYFSRSQYEMHAPLTLDIHSDYLFDENSIKRNAIIKRIRGTDTVFLCHQGLIHIDFVDFSKRCLDELSNQVSNKNIKYIFSLERGGSLLADQLQGVLKKKDYEVTVTNIGKPTPYNKIPHIKEMLQTIQNLWDNYGEQNIAIAETYVGGASINTILTEIAKSELSEHISKVTFVLEHQTIHTQNAPQVGTYEYYQYLVNTQREPKTRTNSKRVINPIIENPEFRS